MSRLTGCRRSDGRAVTTSADAPLGQPGGRRQIGVGLNGINSAALGGENGFDGHWSLWVAPDPVDAPVFDDSEVARYASG
jgi:hypothetical protein